MSERCGDCGHGVNVHTAKAHNHKGGCAYCKCTIHEAASRCLQCRQPDGRHQLDCACR